MQHAIDIIVVEQSDTLIYFRWSSTEDVCRVKRGNQVVYTGTQNFFKDEELIEGELYTYTIERLDGSGKWMDKIKMQTGTENRKIDSMNRLAELVITTIVSESRISLAWGKIDGITTFDIYRNSEWIETVEKNQYTDRAVSNEQHFTYWVRGKRPVTKPNENDRKKPFTLNKLFGSLNPSSPPEKAAMEEFWITKKIAPLQSLLNDTEEQVKHPIWHFRYNTFLPDSLLKNPNLLSPFHYFKGDDRKFDPEATQYRTHVKFTVSFQDTLPTLTWDKNVGPTIGYNWRKKFSKADVASDEKINLKKTVTSDSKCSLVLTHSVGNPLTTSPAIDYNLSASFHRNGIYDVISVHDQSPNHEVYLKLDNETEWTELHQSESEGLAFMAGPTANKYWRLSNFC